MAVGEESAVLECGEGVGLEAATKDEAALEGEGEEGGAVSERGGGSGRAASGRLTFLTSFAGTTRSRFSTSIKSMSSS